MRQTQRVASLVDGKPHTDHAKPRDTDHVKPRDKVKEDTEAMEWEATEPDFDDNNDPDMCGEYCKDIFENECLKEHKWVMASR